MKKPTENPHAALARDEELVVQELSDEVLIYDLRQHKAHCLNQTAAFVWNHCDGETSADEIANLMEKEWRTPVNADAVWFALFGPANMPAELVNKIHADVGKVLDQPQTKEFFAKQSFERVTDSPAEFAKLVDHDIAKWGALIKQVGAKID